MAAGAFDMSGFEPATDSAQAPVRDKKEAPVDLEGFQPEAGEAPAEEKPSFIKRAADAADWFGKFAAPDPSGTAGSAAVGAFDKAGEKLEHGYEHLGDVNVPYGSANGKQLRADVSAFDVPGATKAAIALGTAPVLGAEVAAGGPLAALGLGIGVPLSNYAGHKTREALDWAFPSRSFHARLIKRMAEEGVSNAAFLAAPSIIKGFSAANALRDPGLVPEEAPEPPATAKAAPEGGLPPESPTQAESVQQGPLSKLTAKPATEPVAPGMTGPTEMGPEPAAEEPKGPTELGAPASPPEAAGVATTKPAAPTLRPLHEMTRDELDAEFEKSRAAETKDLNALFGGDGATKYRRLLRAENSSDFTRADAAIAQREEMESKLSPEQQDQLFNSTEYHDPEEVKDYRRALGQIDDGSPAELGDSLKYALTKLSHAPTDPAQMTGEQRMAYAQLQEGLRIAQEKGFDPTKVSERAVQGAAAQFSDPADAAFMLERYLKPQGAEPAALPAPAQPTAEELAQEKATSEAAKELGQYPGGDVQKVPTDQIHTSPERFQYKLNTNKEGAGVSLNKAKFNPDLAETALLYHDPEDGKLYVVNGHNRLSRAKQDNFPYLESKVVDGGNGYPGAIAHNVSVEDARSLGAIQNIASEKGTAVDAAKFFRDQKAGPEEIKKIGIDMSAKMTEDALALKKLDDNLFRFVTVGELTPNQGVIIGDELGDSPAGQNAAFKWLKGREKDGKDIPNDVLREVARDIRDAGESTGQSDQGGLFGDDFMKKSLFEERGTIMAGIKRKLAAERSAFGNAAKNKAKLEGVGNVLTDDNALIADQADNRIKILNAKKTGPINEVLNDAARQISENPKNKNKIIDEAYKAITKAADETLPQEQAPEEPGLFGKPAKAPMEPGTTLGVSVPGGPQIARALEPAIKYAGEMFARGGKDFQDWVKTVLMPQTLGPLAKRSAEQLITNRSEQAARIVPDEVAFAPIRQWLEKYPADEWRKRYAEFYDYYERGEVPPELPKQMAPLMKRIKQATDQRHDLDNVLRAKLEKSKIPYLENYLPHIYADDPIKVQETLRASGRQAGKPMSGPTPFLNARKYLDIASAMKAGLTPRFKNPIDMLLAGLKAFDAHIMVQQQFLDMKDAGMLRFFKPGDYEEGWEKIPDKFFAVASKEGGEVIPRGEWRAPSEVVRVMENHLLPSAAETGGIGAPLKFFGAGSSVAKFNAYRVGFSTFHFLNEANAAMATFQGAGLARAMAGAIAGDTAEMRNGLRIFGHATTDTGAASLIGATLRAAGKENAIGLMNELYMHGDKMMRSLVQPGTEGEVYDRAVQAAIEGGMRFKPEQIGTMSEIMDRAIKEVIHPLAKDIEMRKRGGSFVSPTEDPTLVRMIRGAMRTPGNLANASSAALMQKIVPTVKLGAFYKLAEQELGHYIEKTGGQLPWAMQRQILQNVAHHVDSVFGQMVEDNLMMSRTMKDILHMGIAYPGWNIGSLRLVWKAGKGTLRVGKDMSFKNLDTQERLAMQFMLGLGTSQTIQNALLMRVLAGTWPKTMQDLVQPQDGNKDTLGNPTRIASPSYARTYYSLSHHPIAWAQNIQNPVLGLMDDIYNNRERFTGRQIWDPQAPLRDHVKQSFEYFWRFAAPFSVSNANRMEGASGPKKLLGYAGYSPVPAQYLRTEAENYVYKLAGDKAPRVGLNEQQYAAKQTQNALEDAIRDGKKLDQQHLDTLNKLDPALKEKVEADAAKAAQLPRIVNMMRRMDLHEVIKTYKMAERNGDVRNQKYAKAILEDKTHHMSQDKWDAELDKLNPSEREQYRTLLREILTGTPPEGSPTGPEA